jgi:hypothetical protein
MVGAVRGAATVSDVLALVERLDRLIALMEKNERDRELSPWWQHGDGRAINRLEWEAMEARPVGWKRDRDFYGNPREAA